MSNFKKYKYNLITIKFTDNNHYRYIQSYLASHNIFWNGEDRIDIDDKGRHDVYLYVILNSNFYSSRRSSYLVRSSVYDNVFIENFNYDPKIYEIKDIDKIRMIIEHGGFIPSYKPKKITRCL